MAKGRRFYKKNNGQPGGVQAEGQVKPQDGNPANKPGGNVAKKPGGKPPRKFMPREQRPNDAGAKPGRNQGQKREQPKPSGKVLVAYYSWSGVTAKAAERIASAAKGNSYRIVPVKPYSSVYALCVAKGGVEKASGARPEIKGTLPDCSRYDKIAIGFPIWWFSCPMIIHSFLEKVKLDGKTVYPFCTSKTSGPKGSAADIRKTVPNATVKECLDANKLESMSDEDIKKWLEM